MLSAFMGRLWPCCWSHGLGTGKPKTGLSSLYWPVLRFRPANGIEPRGLSHLRTFQIVVFLTAGSLSGITWQSLVLTIPWILDAGFVSLLLLRAIIDPGSGGGKRGGAWHKHTGGSTPLSTIVVLYSGCASVSLVGGFSFLGLIVPHIVRFLTGEDYRRLFARLCTFGGDSCLSLVDAACLSAFDTPVWCPGIRHRRSGLSGAEHIGRKERFYEKVEHRQKAVPMGSPLVAMIAAAFTICQLRIF